jgi:hypothetical protein
MELAVEGGTNDWGEVVTRFGTSSTKMKWNNVDILYSVLNAHRVFKDCTLKTR